MSHGWCRLNLRQEVLEVDALMSAMLYEEMLASRNGKLRRCSVCVCGVRTCTCIWQPSY